MKDLVIIGAGGFGREICFHIQRINEVVPTWNVLGMIDEVATETVEGYPVLGNLDYFLTMDPKPYYFIAIANSEVRHRIAERCKTAGFKAGSVIYPDVIIGPGCEIGEGCFVGFSSILMNNAKIGAFCIIQPRSILGHDTTVGNFTSMMTDASIAGETHIGSHCYFGLRCTVINQINITDHCTFGACACVVKDVDVPGTYVGVPAKLIKPLQK